MATCIKDQRFLANFYKQLCLAAPLKYPRYPYVSECWGEHNYVRCDVSPVVFNYLKDGSLVYSYEQHYPFKPETLRVDKDGYIYHEFKEGIEGVFGGDLVAQLADQLHYKDAEAQLDYQNRSYSIRQK